MTAVEWLLEELKKVHHPTEAMIIYAKKLEREQHNKTWFDSTSQFDNSAEMTYKKDFEQYYTSTYGSKGSAVAKRLKEEMPKHIADYVDAYAEQIANLEKSIIEDQLKNNK